MKRTGHALWNGDLKTGKGELSTASGVLRDTPYSYTARFEDGAGANPEELIGAAHAGCFSMALAMILSEERHAPDEIRTQADVTLEKAGEGFEITAVHLSTRAKVSSLDADGFEKFAKSAKDNCPVSKLLKAEITLDAGLD
ncbi:MAG: OsmC family protein [Oceanicaulis sp.]